MGKGFLQGLMVFNRQGIEDFEGGKKMKSGFRNCYGLVAVLIVVACTCEGGFGAPVYIPGVPDWDQPALAAGQAPGGPWGAWCTPTATANIVGYYNDNGVAGIGDNQAFPATPPWKDPHWQDDTADAADRLSLFFYGKAGNAFSTNDQMWVELEDTSSTSGVAIYNGDASDVAEPGWHEWNIDLGIFAAAGVSLANVDKVHIGFGGPQVGQVTKGGTGTVWFEDIIVSGPQVVDDFDSYDSDAALKTVWEDYWTNGTYSEVFVETNPTYVRDGNSMRFLYDNQLKYMGKYVGSRIDADISNLAIGPNWQTGLGGVAQTGLGWYLNTNDHGLGGNPGSPGYRGTKRQHIVNGATGNGGLIGGGSGYFPSAGLSEVCVAVYGSHTMGPNEYAITDTTGEPDKADHNDAAAFIQIRASIDANRPLLGHFEHFHFQSKTRALDPNFGENPNYDHATWADANAFPYEDEETGEVWDPNEGLGHTVTIVGYWLSEDAGNPLGADAIIVHDNADGTLPGPTALPLVLPWAGSPWKALTLIKGVESPYYDINGDCFVNFLDLKLLAAYWLE
ncbi:MAG: hypothetical protein JSV99_11300 [Planctomycetota bacterium]|nr:MAG: hypothetical protein JSV99_11300 [Planctomycetota bacterium]